MYADTRQQGELALVPSNTTLHSCPHVHMLHMPFASRPFKLIRLAGESAGILSYETRAALRYVTLMRRVPTCACARRWAMSVESLGLPGLSEP